MPFQPPPPKPRPKWATWIPGKTYSVGRKNGWKEHNTKGQATQAVNHKLYGTVPEGGAIYELVGDEWEIRERVNGRLYTLGDEDK